MATTEAATNQSHSLSAEELRKIDAYWHSASYLSVGQIYLQDNPLLSEPLELHHIKPYLLDHRTVPPILHLSDCNVANPALFAPISRKEQILLLQLFQGYGYRPYLMEGEDAADLHQKMATNPDRVMNETQSIQQQARHYGNTQHPRWSLVILRTPKSRNGPKVVDRQKTEGSWRSHLLPLANPAKQPEGIRQIAQWLQSYRPEELFDAKDRLAEELRTLL